MQLPGQELITVRRCHGTQVDEQPAGPLGGDELLHRNSLGLISEDLGRVLDSVIIHVEKPLEQVVTVSRAYVGLRNFFLYVETLERYSREIL